MATLKDIKGTHLWEYKNFSNEEIKYIQQLREQIEKFFISYNDGYKDPYGIDLVSIENAAYIVNQILTDLYIKTAPPEEKILTDNIAEQILPLINSKEILKGM